MLYVFPHAPPCALRHVVVGARLDEEELVVVDSVLRAEVEGFDPSAAVSEAGALLRHARCLLLMTPPNYPRTLHT